METIILANGHVVLPHEICRRLALEAGVRLEASFDPKSGCIYLRPVKRIYTLDKVKKERKSSGRKVK